MTELETPDAQRLSEDEFLHLLPDVSDEADWLNHYVYQAQEEAWALRVQQESKLLPEARWCGSGSFLKALIDALRSSVISSRQ